ncbi:E3 ubiquitin-protein ligase TM129 [Anopheles ziemanni]|uniref:E3 ubiquitin-protein ligase TM129 n=1 Tax=Anopheles coustani TaxID=139045 RepID=UPI002657D46C|nr:E3 ubiquitin-protein ligase TM129 [Anopheles coustani]XP_058174019.1 E3 ubiquitin-protein ligase TM129 [Anopheles ziemanni]
MIDVIYFFVFVVLCFFTIFPTTEIESVGLTVDQWCSRYVTDGFVQYHIKLTSFKLLLHTSMPLCYFLVLWLLAWINPAEFGTAVQFTVSGQYLWNISISLAIALFIVTNVNVLYWAMDAWSNHPIAKKLQRFTTPMMPDWRSVATNINDEYRRDTKMVIRSNAISTLVVTESWIIKTNLYGISVARQNESSLVAYKVDFQDVLTDTVDATQFINIAVKPPQERLQFTIRVNGDHFKDFQDHVNRPIVLLPSVQFRSVIDRFVDVFKEQVALNPIVPSTAIASIEGDNCLACLQVIPDVKIQKHCLDVGADGLLLPDDQRCQPCHCRPLWCVSCLALWFASRQQKSERDTWLSKKATCPMCRARFCVLDVCMIEENVGRIQE